MAVILGKLILIKFGFFRPLHGRHRKKKGAGTYRPYETYKLCDFTIIPMERRWSSGIAKTEIGDQVLWQELCVQKKGRTDKLCSALYSSSFKNYFLNFFRDPTRPIRPVPRRNIVAGSGTGALPGSC